MKTKNHLSDHELRQVVLEQETDLSTEQIEEHVSSCQWCQDRLLEMAANDTWRDGFSSSIQEMPDLGEPLDTCAYGHPKSPQGDEYDLLTVEQMLGEVLEPPTHPEMMGRLDRYDIESILGCGGMGVVLRGFDRDLHRPVAIKMILPRLSKNGTSKQRFEREARAAAAVLHPNVIAIHGISKSVGVPWFVMPLVGGPSLSVLVRSNGPMPEREIVRIGQQIAAGLAAAHSQGLVHRDIKPENILVDNQINRVVITDFGLARRESEESMTQTGMLAGTVNYMSPEQSRGEDLDSRSDLFSLGSLLFYLATGVVPFKADSPMKVLHLIGNQPHPDVRSLNPEISGTLSDLIDRLLSKSPEHRFQSAVEVESFLNDYTAHLNHPTKVKRPQVPGRNSASFIRTPVAIATTLFLVAAMILIGFYLPTLWGNDPSNTTNNSIGNSVDSNTNPRVTANEIRKKYNLESEDEFSQQVRQFAEDVQQLSRGLSNNDFPYSDTVDPSLNQLSNQIDSIRRAIDVQ